MRRVVALFGYSGSNESELSFAEGAQIDVLDEGEGDGWKNGRNVATGAVGWFPSNYVQDVAPAATPYASDADFADPDFGVPAAGAADAAAGGYGGFGGSAGSFGGGAGGGGFGAATPRPGGSMRGGNPLARMSILSTTRGADDYFSVNLSSAKTREIELSRKLDVVLPGPRWLNAELFTVAISNPEKRSKLAGMKEFIAYTITSSNGHSVERRYKHFDWLSDRMASKFQILALPPLPEKQLAGRFEDVFVERRRALLERWMNRVVRHPVLRNSELLQHFLTITEETAWKAGKRKAEKDPIKGAEMFLTVVCPDTNSFGYDGDIESMNRFGKFAKTMSKDLQSTLNALESFNKTADAVARQYDRLSFVIGLLAGAVPHRGEESVLNNQQCWDSREGNTEHAQLTMAMADTSKAFKQVAEAWTKEPAATVHPLIDDMRDWVGLIPQFAPVLDFHANGVRKLKDVTDPAVVKKTERVFNATLAEMNRFHDERREDFNRMMRAFLTSHINHHLYVAAQLSAALQQFPPM